MPVCRSSRAVTALARVAAVVGCVLALSACSPVYVVRAGYEEARILWARESIEDLLDADDLSRDESAKLELVLDVRAFARDRLGLHVDGSYATVSRVDDAPILHVLSAAEQLRLQPYTWWFPIVGRVPYKGFFARERALAAAAKLEAEGFDTYVRPAGGFSTLGWFDDPLLSSQLRMESTDLANLVLHELLHTTSYTPGQAAFAESFASFVGYRGAMLFFAERGATEEADLAEAEWRDAVAFSAFLARALERLGAAYERGVTLEERGRLLFEIQSEWAATRQRTDRYSGFAARPLNNAILLQLRVYHRRLGLFDELLDSFGGDLAKTVAAVIGATEGEPDAFAATDALLGRALAVRDASGLELADPLDTETAGENERQGAEGGGGEQ